MTPEQIQELLDRLFEIGGAVASKGWEIAIRQVYAIVAINAVWLAVVVAVGVLMLPLYRKASRMDDGTNEDSEMLGEAGRVVSVIIFLVCVVVVPFLLTGLVVRLVNPEWYAVQLLLDLVH